MSTAQDESIGRIEVAPEVLNTIARFASLEIEGVSEMASVQTERGRRFRRSNRGDGVALRFSDDDKLIFDIFVNMDPQVNITETSRKLQASVIEAMDKMVGLDVGAVNIHIEDVIYESGEAA